jgi:hypothetical protein
MLAVFIRRFVKCYEANGTSLTVHLADGKPRRERWRGATLCNDERRDLLPLPEGTRPFEPVRDLGNICPDCRAVYERQARELMGVPPVGRLVF